MVQFAGHPARIAYGKGMIRIAGVLLALFGLILVGMSGDNQRVPNTRRLTLGMVAMAIGALVAIFATQVALMMGWEHP